MAGQRNRGSVSEYQLEFFRVTQETANRFNFEVANHDRVFSWLQYSRTQTINTRILDPGATTNGDTDNVYSIHSLDDAEVDGCHSGWKRIRQRDLSAEVGERRSLRNTEVGEAAGDSDLLPIRGI